MTCQDCGRGLAGGVWHGGDARHEAGRYCVSCAEIVAFWRVIDGDDAAPCEGCGVHVFDGDACYDMAAVFCPACWIAKLDGEPIDN